MTDNEIAAAPYQPPAVEQAPVFGGLFSRAEILRMPPGMRLMFDKEARSYFEEMAREMSNPQSPMTLPHLKGNPHLAFSIIRKAMNWCMDPDDVAQATSTPGGGKLAFEGKLIAGAMLNSGKVKSIRYEHGPTRAAWQKVDGKFEMKPGKRTDKQGKPIMYHAARYTAADEAGLFVKAIATMHDGSEVETPEIYLNACHPRNATPWAYRPSQQICNVAARMLGQIACPEILFGAQFDVGLATEDRAENMRVVSPDGTAPEIIEPEPEVETEEVKEKEKPANTKRQRVGRAPRMQITFRDKVLYKTAFVRDIKHLLKTSETMEQLAQLHTQFVKALLNVSEEHDDLLAQLNPLFTARRDELMPPEEEEAAEDYDDIYEEYPEDEEEGQPQLV